ncbi:MAG: NAD(P)-dependent alcohol dehydrogenase [Acidimicrobiia bacterium]
MGSMTEKQVDTMLSTVQERYGAPAEVLRLREIGKPSVGRGEVLVQVHATSVSGTDWHLMRGLPYAARFVTGLRKPKNLIPGLDVSGVVEAVADDVTTFRPGDEVFGWCAGSYAEYASVPADQLSVKPAGITLTQAGAIPIAGFTALQAMRDKGEVGHGQKVLITGASGGVGMYAVQIAKWLGAEVTAVCSTAKMGLVRSIGADHVIDYTRHHFVDGAGRYDVIVDLYGNPTLSDYRKVLAPGGTLVCVGGTGGRWFMGVDRWMRWLAVAPFLDLKVRPLIHKDSHDDLVTLRALIEAGSLAPVIDRSYPMAEAADAIQFVTDGHAHGQVVLTMTGFLPGDDEVAV